MNRKSLTWGLVSLGMVVLLLGARGARAETLPQPTVDYSADMEMDVGGMRMTGKVYRSGEKQRQEMNMGGQQQVMIMRRDQGVSLMIMPQQRMYMRMPLGPQQNQGPNTAEGEWSRTKVGTETVNGVTTTKYTVSHQGPDGQMDGVAWMTDENIMVRMEMDISSGGRRSHMRRELKNLKTGKVDAALFEPPAGFRKMQMPQGMPPGMQGGRRR